MASHTLRARLGLGDFLNRLFDMGLEFCLAVILVVNGRAALYSGQAHHKSVAPFLSSALRFLSPDARWLGATLALLGALQGILVLHSAWNKGQNFLARTFFCGVGMLFYAAISVSVVTGTEPPIAAERYEANAAFFFFGCVVLAGRALPLSRSARRGKT